MFKIQWIFALLFGLSLYLCQTQQCSPKYDLDNILQDQIVINSVAAIDDNQQISTSASYLYPFPRTLFSATPKILSTIDSYQIASMSEINYFLNIQVTRSLANFTFTSQNMNWTFVRVKLWLLGRSDILVGNFVLQNISPSQDKTFQIAIPSTFSSFVDEKTIHLNYITGLQAQSSGSLYQIDVKNSGKSVDGSIFKVTVSALNLTTITKIQVSYSIFNFESSFFASGGGQINYVSISGSQYKKIHGSFAPIIYIFSGFDHIKLQTKNKNLTLEYNLDSDYVLETYAQNKIDQLGVVYLSIGAQPATVCGTCNQYIQSTACVNSCPPLTYPYIAYAKGGKTCLTCSAKLNQTINEFNTGCNCNQGFSRVDQACIQKSITDQTTCADKNSILSNGVCVCIAGTQKVNGLCQAICSKNEQINTSTQKCQCTFGYYNISGVCSTCPSTQIYNQTYKACMCPDLQQFDTSLFICKCLPLYYNFSNTCVAACPTFYTISGNSCVPSQKCIATQTFENGKCVCPGNSYIVNSTCSVCPATTYYNSTSQTCINCMSFCAVCFNNSVCAECKKQYFYNATINQCILNQTCGLNEALNTSTKSCQCVNGFNRVNGTCTTCQNGKYYDTASKTCKSCVIGCQQCNSSVSCTLCQTNSTFTPSLGYCAPTCGANQTYSLATSKCECLSGMYRIKGVCSKCPNAQFYDSNSQGCFPCLSNCLTCINPASCDKCMTGYYFNLTTGTCQISNCPVNETIGTDGKCTCIDGTYRISGVCGQCKAAQFYSVRGQTCGDCPNYCVRCANQATCLQCQPYHKLINSQCIFDLYDIKQGYPKFTQNFVITDFTSTQPTLTTKLTPEQLESIVKIDIKDDKVQPKQTIIQQNPNNQSQIRIIYSYCRYVPLSTYNITYTFKDPNIGQQQDIDTVNYNVLDKKYTNFINQ